MISLPRAVARSLALIVAVNVVFGPVAAWAAETGSGSASTGATLRGMKRSLPTASGSSAPDPKGSKADAMMTTQRAGTAGATGQAGGTPPLGPAPQTLRPEPDVASGALTYAYPILTPPGRNGLGPMVSLAYNSQNTAEGSLVGHGWSLGIPAIERANKSGADRLYSDNFFVSSLSGDLTNTGGNQYAGLNEGGDFITYSFTGNAWTATDKQGTIYRFGTTGGSRQDDLTDPSRIAKWMLEEVRDTRGNFVRYEYWKDGGQIYPARIVYTGHDTTDGIFSVEFLRAPRPDTTKSMQTGFAVTTAHRVAEIQTRIRGNWVRKYVLRYGTGSNGIRSILTGITESGRSEDGTVTTLPTATFTFSDGHLAFAQGSGISYPTASWTDSNGTVHQDEPISLTDPAVRLLDLNGDGLKDIAKSSNVQVNGVDFPIFWVMLNTGSGWQRDTGWTQPTYAFTNGQGVAVTARYTFDSVGEIVDWNGDGRDDLIRFWAENLGNGTSKQHVVVLLNTGSGWTQDATVTTDMPTYIDQNGDEQPLYVTSGSGAPSHLFMDLNGDGMTDYLHASNTQSNGVDNPRFAVLYNRSGRLVRDATVTTPWVSYSTNGTMTTTPLSLGSGVQPVDLNGDGLLDFIKAANSQTNGVDYSLFWVLLNTGHGWVQAPWEHPRYSYLDQDGTPQSAYFTTISDWRPSDVNGDGLIDYLRLWTTQLGGGAERDDKAVLVNTGNGWVQNDAVITVGRASYVDAEGVERTMYPGTGNASISVLDMDGDGTEDFVRIGFTQSAGISTPLNWVLRGTRLPGDLPTGLTLPTGGGYQFGYGSTATARASDGTPLNPALPFPLRIVTTVLADNGMGIATAHAYTYIGGRYYFGSATDRRFAGFAQVVSRDPLGNQTVTWYHQGNASDSGQGEYQDHPSKIGRSYRVERQDATGKRFSSTITRHDRSDLGHGRSFVFASSVLTQDFDGGTTHRDRAVTTSYDSLGNPTRLEDWGEVSGNSDGTFTDLADGGTVTLTAYAASAGSAVRSQPCVVSITDRNGILLAESRSYYDSLPLCQVSKGLSTRAERLLMGQGYYATATAYDARGLPTSTTDGRGNTTTVTYDTDGLYPTTVTNPLGHAVVSAYDFATGQVKQTTDPNGAQTRTTFDGLGRTIRVEVSDPASPTTWKAVSTVSYQDATLPLRTTATTYNGQAGDQGIETIEYRDGLGNALQTRSTAEGAGRYSVVSKTYDAAFRLLKETLPVFSDGASYTAPSPTDRGNQFAYDALGRVTGVSNAVGTITTSYAPWARTITDANGRSRTITNDASGKTVRVTEPLGAVTTYGYDVLGRLTGITDAEGNVRSFIYDSLGRLRTQDMLHAPGQDPTTYGSWTYTYDANDNVVSRTDPKGQTIATTYDALNRPVAEDFSGQAGVEISLSYDTGTYGKGRIASSTAQGITTAYTYDLLGRTTKTTWTVNGVARSQNATYDLSGNPLSVAYPNGKTIAMTYDGTHRPTMVKQGTVTMVSNIDYAPNGAIARIDYGNGVSTTNTYDIAQLYRLTGKATSKGASTFQNLVYSYDPGGNITRITESAPTAAKRTVDYGYDQLDRLTSAAYSNVASGQAGGTQSFAYSLTGNLLSSGLGTYQYARTGFANPQAVTAVAGDRSYSYDQNGNLTGSTVAGVANVYTYDYRDRMVKSKKGAAAEVVYQYDHGYNRIKKWDKNGNKITLSFGDFEIEGTGDTTGKLATTTLSRINVSLGGGQAVSLEYNGSNTLTNRAYHHTDHLSGSSIVTNASGAVVQTLDYHPFGAVRTNAKTGTYDNRKKFTGKELDSETGLTFFGARYYDQDIGRWMGWDPIQRDPATLVKSGELNGYAYVKNSPLTGIDPDGLLTLVLNGTDMDGDGPGGDESFNTELGKKYLERIGDTFGETAEAFKWEGLNNSVSRSEWAQKLADRINGHSFQDGEKLNIVAHSHGGNVALEATYLINRAIDNLVTLGTPVRDDYQAKPGMVRNHVQAYSSLDLVQRNGGYNYSGKFYRDGITCDQSRSCNMFFNDIESCTSGGFSCSPVSFETGWAGRKFRGATNLNMTFEVSFSSYAAHSQLWQKASVWDKVKEELHL